MRRHLGLIIVSAFLAVAALGTAAPAYADEAVAILGIEAIEVGDALGTQLTDALRRKAAETPGIRLIPGKDLVELKMVFGCDGEAPACLAQAGRSLGADRLIYGTLRKAEQGRAVAVSLKLLDVRDLAVLRQVTEMIPKKGLGPAVLNAAAVRWFGQLVVAPGLGSISVQSQPPDAQVLLDGASVGKTPLKLKELRPRTYTVTVQLEGFSPSVHTVDVPSGGNQSIIARLEPLPREPTRPPPPVVGRVETPPVPPPAVTAEPPRKLHPGRPAKYAAIGLVAGAVVAGAVAIYTWRSYLTYEDNASARLRDLAPATGSTEQRLWFAEPRCQTPPGVSPDAARQYVSDCDKGTSLAHATTGLWVTAGLLATAGVVSFIVGDRLDAKAERERRLGQGIKQSLRLVPALSTQGGGLSASFEF